MPMTYRRAGKADVSLVTDLLRKLYETPRDELFAEMEAYLLGRKVEKDVKVSMEKERQLGLTDTDSETLMRRAASGCESLCQSSGNKISVKAGPGPLPLRVDDDGIYRVLYGGHGIMELVKGDVTIENGANVTALGGNGTVQGGGVGFDGSFNSEGNITRQDLAVILWLYAQYAGYDVSVCGDS